MKLCLTKMNLDISGVEILGYQSRLLRSKGETPHKVRSLLSGPENKDVSGGLSGIREADNWMFNYEEAQLTAQW